MDVFRVSSRCNSTIPHLAGDQNCQSSSCAAVELEESEGDPPAQDAMWLWRGGKSILTEIEMS